MMDSIQEPEARSQKPTLRKSTWLLIAVIAAVAVLRLYYCTRIMEITGDVIRHLLYGHLVGQLGLDVAGRPLNSFHGLAGVSWSFVPYNYPIVTLLFFSGVAAIMPSIFFAKLALTAIEGVNAWLVWRFSGNRWLGALYWASPVSIWWVSREGQFEPLQNLFVLGALCLLGRSAPLAFLLLALGVQVKLTAGLLLPLFVMTALREKRRMFPCALGFLGGLLPTVLAQQAYPVINVIANNLGALHYNPYFWNPMDLSWRGWLAPWLSWTIALVTWPTLLYCAWGFIRPRKFGTTGWWPGWDYLAPLLFMIALKTQANIQFWYLILWPSFVLPIADRRERWAMMILYPLLDITSTLAICGILLGPLNPPGYQLFNVFAPLR